MLQPLREPLVGIGLALLQPLLKHLRGHLIKHPEKVVLLGLPELDPLHRSDINHLDLLHPR